MQDHEKETAALIEELRAARARIEALEAGDEPWARENNFKELAEASPDGIVVADPESRIVYANTRAAEITGYSVDELVGLVGFESITRPQDRAGYRKIMEQRMGGEAHQATYERIVVRKDGTEVNTEFTTTTTLWRGAPAPMATIRDITERKRLEEETAELEALLRRSQKMEAIGQLAGGVAHNFNNVLCVITGNAELVLDDLPAESPLRESMEDISEAANQAARLTRQLLTFTRKHPIEPKTINLSQLMQRMHSMLTQLIGEDVILRTETTERPGWIRVDPGQVEQVLLNLVVNARDAMPNGGDLLIETADVSQDDDRLFHGKDTPGDYVMVAISDTGCGMSAEVSDRIFEPFFTTKDQGEGTGLGLSTAYAIVEQNGGRIAVTSEPGKGSTFKVYFPRVDVGAETHAGAQTHDPAGAQETVLVVEDEEMVRNLAVKLLDHRGYQVLSASSGAEALALVEHHEGPIDLLLTDVVMPHMDGRELADRALDRRPGMKVLYTSGYTKNLISQHGVRSEDVSFIAKPYSLGTLAARVREVLDGE